MLLHIRTEQHRDDYLKQNKFKINEWRMNELEAKRKKYNILNMVITNSSIESNPQIDVLLQI